MLSLESREPGVASSEGTVPCTSHPCSARPCSNGAQCRAMEEGGAGGAGVLVLGAGGARGRATCNCAKGWRGRRCHKKAGKRRGRSKGRKVRKGKKLRSKGRGRKRRGRRRMGA